jgi:glycosyltransferase involved in cell wall biosynthesis
MPRKNIGTLVMSFELLAAQFSDLHLVLTGGAGYDSNGVLQQIETSPFKGRIHLTGWVSDQDLGALYAGATALVFPSKHEGFGLPIVEAMACGTPVIASPEAASMEIAGNAVMRVDCSEASALADAVVQVLTDKALRERLIQLGRTQARPFTIEACASATLLLYQEAFEYRNGPSVSERVFNDIQPATIVRDANQET